MSVPGKTKGRFYSLQEAFSMHRRLLLAVAVSLLFTSCTALFSPKEPEQFIRVHGGRFYKGNQPYYYAGTNLWYGCYLGSPGETGNRERLLRELDSLKADGIVNLRVLGASEESYIRRSLKPAIQRAPGALDDSLLEGLDYLLDAMAERRMHAVIFLNNYWEWSGGMAQYNDWANGGGGVDPEDPAKGWGAFMNYSATFYTNDKANVLFRNYVRSVVTRKNSVNGRRYNEDPTIMAWELANEPRPGTDSPTGVANLPAFYRWIDETAGYIHSLDTLHLVTGGSEGTVGCLQNDDYFLRTYSTPNIDYLNFHLWPLNWSWYDPKRPAETVPQTEANALAYINKHIALARKLNKPIVMEEFGIGRDTGSVTPGTPTTIRDHYFGLLFKTLYDSARAGAPVAGSNFWGWGGEGRNPHPDKMWRRGDPFVGDPPQEAQGLNSVFVTDTSTVRIIREHAFKMMRLGKVDTLLVRSKP